MGRRIVPTSTILVCSFLLAGLTACSGTSSTAPTTPALERRDLTYAINVPDLVNFRALSTAYPNGIYMAPVTAQDRYNFSPEYGGTPNVYAGPSQTTLRTYTNTGIVTAPYDVASRDVFPASLWPDEYKQFAVGVEYAWLGRFTYSVFVDPSARAR